MTPAWNRGVLAKGNGAASLGQPVRGAVECSSWWSGTCIIRRVILQVQRVNEFSDDRRLTLH